MVLGGVVGAVGARIRTKELIRRARSRLQRNRSSGPAEEIIERPSLPNPKPAPTLPSRDTSRPSMMPMREILPRQFAVFRFYARGEIQILVAVLIFGNFIVSATQAEVLPEYGSVGDQVFYGFE